MPKMKTKKAVSHKVKLTGTGKLLRRQSGKRHLLTKKTSKRKRQLGKAMTVAETHLKTYKRLMCVL